MSLKFDSKTMKFQCHKYFMVYSTVFEKIIILIFFQYNLDKSCILLHCQKYFLKLTDKSANNRPFI
jgi:hypothetical protein